MKSAAINPRDIGVSQKLEEAKRIAEVIREQRKDADSQRLKMIQEKKMAQAKAREMSIAAAKAKASAEKAYRVMVGNNNKVCGQCAVGAKRVKQRRGEIDSQNKQAQRQKDTRRAAKEKHCKKGDTSCKKAAKTLRKLRGAKKTKKTKKTYASSIKQKLRQRKVSGSRR